MCTNECEFDNLPLDIINAEELFVFFYIYIYIKLELKTIHFYGLLSFFEKNIFLVNEHYFLEFKEKDVLKIVMKKQQALDTYMCKIEESL